MARFSFARFRTFLLPFFIISPIFALWRMCIFFNENARTAVDFHSAFGDFRNVVFVTAHPDDEIMFFGPSLEYFAQNSQYKVHILCLSSKNTLRETELRECVRSISENISVEMSEFHDSLQAEWKLEEIGETVKAFYEQHNLTRTNAIFVTFDRNGVSKHPNHCAIGKYFQEQKEYPVAFLQSEKWLLMKYFPLFSLFRTLIVILSKNAKQTVVVIGRNWFFTLQKMAHHKSQLVWYRYFWCFLSSYLTQNAFSVRL